MFGQWVECTRCHASFVTLERHTCEPHLPVSDDDLAEARKLCSDPPPPTWSVAESDRIAGCRGVMPRLIAEIERLRAIVKVAKRAVDMLPLHTGEELRKHAAECWSCDLKVDLLEALAALETRKEE